MKNNLWAPWRMEYVTNPNKGKNIFLEKSKSKNDRENLVLYRGLHSFVLMNLYPYNNGHIMIAPYAQHNDLTELDTKTLFEIMELTQKSIERLDNRTNELDSWFEERKNTLLTQANNKIESYIEEEKERVSQKLDKKMKNFSHIVE